MKTVEFEVTLTTSDDLEITDFISYLLENDKVSQVITRYDGGTMRHIKASEVLSKEKE